MQPTKIGFLPLYLKLYDELFPEMRETMEKFSSNIQSELLSKGIEVIPKSFLIGIDQFIITRKGSI